MSLSFLAMFIVVALGLLLLGGIVAVIRRRWRPLGFALLGLLVVAGVVLTFRVSARPLGMRAQPASEVYYHDNSYSFPTPPRLPQPPRPPQPPRVVINTGPRGQMHVEVAPPPELAKKNGNILLAMGNALGKVIQEQKPKPPLPITAEKEPPKADEKADAKTVDDARTNELVKNLTAAVLAELPADVDEYTALRTLARYLARAIAEERGKTVAGQVASMPVAVEKPVATSMPVAAEKPVEPSAKRPDWVDAVQGKVGDAYQFVTTVGPYTTRLECDHALPAQLRAVVAEYAELYLGPEAQGRVTLSDDCLRRYVLKEEWEETKSTSVGPMVELHALLQFDSKTNRELEQNWRNVRIEDRLWLTGGGLGALLAVLGGVFVVMKVDLATQGARRGRIALVLLAVLVFLGVLAVYAMRTSMSMGRPVRVEHRSDMQVTSAVKPDK